MSGVHVLADGNPRLGGMDDDECDQCVHDIVSWFQRKAELPDARDTHDEVDALEKALGIKVPVMLRVLLVKQSGGIWFDAYKSLSADDIMSSADSLSSASGWKRSFVPFAADVDGTALVADTSNKGAVLEFGDDGQGAQVASSLSQYLEEYRNRLLSGQFDFVEDVGLVERSRK